MDPPPCERLLGVDGRGAARGSGDATGSPLAAVSRARHVGRGAGGRSSSSDATCRFAEHEQRIAELGQPGIGLDDVPRELADLPRLLGAGAVAERSCTLLEPAPQTLRLVLDLVHARVAVGEHALQRLEQRRIPCGQRPNAFENGGTTRAAPGHHDDYQDAPGHAHEPRALSFPSVRPRLFPLRILCVLAVAALLAPQGAVASPLRARLHAALAGFDGGGTGALAVDLDTGRAVYAHNTTASLLPASNQKLALTFAALVVLGPSFRIRTEVLGEGRLADPETWQGNLILKGYGDPTLDRGGLVGLARRVRATGIRTVTGSLVADESWFDRRRAGPGWKRAFVPEESRPLSALTVAGATDALGSARLFRAALDAAGVHVAGGTKVARAGGWPLAVLYSSPLRDILRHMDVESDNFTAELLLKQLGAVLAGTGTTTAGATIVRSVLAERNVPLAGVRIADGSGLSALDRMTPKALVTILQRSWADIDLRPVVFGILAVSGRDGTLHDRLARPPARGNVRAKTGTLDGVSALSGFVRERYAFAILQNGRRLSASIARAAQDRFATVLVHCLKNGFTAADLVEDRVG